MKTIAEWFKAHLSQAKINFFNFSHYYCHIRIIKHREEHFFFSTIDYL